MSDKARELLELRAIKISARSALSRPYDDDVKERIKDRADDLLARLAAAVLRDGGSQEVLEAIEAARRELRA